MRPEQGIFPGKIREKASSQPVPKKVFIGNLRYKGNRRSLNEEIAKNRRYKKDIL